MLELVAQWLWLVPFGASFVQRPQTCHCHCAAGAGPSEGILDLLGQQLARCGPEHLRQSCPDCPVCSCPAPPEVVSPLGWVFFAGLCTGGLIAFLVGRLAASYQEALAERAPVVQSQPPLAAELQDGPLPALALRVAAPQAAAGPLTATERRRQNDGGA